MRILIFVVLLLCTVTDVCAADYETIVKRAFESNERTSEKDWAFTETHTAEGVTLVSRFDPRRPVGEQWTLISIDGITPTTEENEEYGEEKRESVDSEAEGEGFGSGFVAPGSLALMAETDTTYRFGFLPNIEDDSEDVEMMRHVSGVLSINKNAHFVESIDLKSTKSFKPERGIKIQTFELSMKFGPTSVDGPIVLLLVDVRVQGRAYLMFKFDEVEETVYSNFVRVTE